MILDVISIVQEIFLKTALQGHKHFSDIILLEKAVYIGS